MKIRFILFLLFFNQQLWAISPFHSDGCSVYGDGYWGIDETLWQHCCFAHDIPYWFGGTQKERAFADRELNRCVRNSSNDINGFIMETGVLVGGLPDTNLPWRWAFGYSTQRGFRQLSETERVEVLSEYPSILLELERFKPNFTEEQLTYIKKWFDHYFEKLQEDSKVQVKSFQKKVAGTRSLGASCRGLLLASSRQRDSVATT